MEYEKIRQIIEDMGNSKLTSMNIEFKDGTKISMQKDSEVTIKKEETSPNSEISISENSDEKFITSPMVGTFYLKPSPDAAPFVTEGDSISKGDPVCIIEAMKLMNEIESDYTGKIVEIYLKDGDPVEYGTKLFKVK